MLPLSWERLLGSLRRRPVRVAQRFLLAARTGERPHGVEVQFDEFVLVEQSAVPADEDECQRHTGLGPQQDG